MTATESIQLAPVHANADFKVMQVTGGAGQAMPTHYASHDAFLTVLQGEVIVEMNGAEHRLKPTDTLAIPARKPHSLRSQSAFRMLVVLKADARIEFGG
ncbi:MAG: cupin domain-containing protein [Cytophagales bacterium]|jgi:quercetin dioxygenase-like cupin family protein|nr:cupin domain-containing protein [Cytophagales bacterium]